ncbi:hypothetical protein T484DRAFT_1758487 [Baffinella frigidus]|nr:hypothetical protein T484DRAFT_1758487 [Cryptophyta sp. CCMP2293]
MDPAVSSTAVSFEGNKKRSTYLALDGLARPTTAVAPALGAPNLRVEVEAEKVSAAPASSMLLRSRAAPPAASSRLMHGPELSRVAAHEPGGGGDAALAAPAADGALSSGAAACSADAAASSRLLRSREVSRVATQEPAAGGAGPSQVLNPQP